MRKHKPWLPQEAVGSFDLMGHFLGYVMSKRSPKGLCEGKNTYYIRYGWSKQERRDLRKDLKRFKPLADEVAKIKKWEI